jgi:hypothetical protein
VQRAPNRIAHRLGFDQESIVSEVRTDDYWGFCGRYKLGYLNLKSRWEEAIGINRDHNGRNCDPLEGFDDSPAVTAYIVRIHGISQRDIGIGIEPLGQLARLMVEI